MSGGATSPAQDHARQEAKITPSGVGQVRLGKTYRELRSAGVVGRLQPGCELSSPRPGFARLRAPLQGSVTLAPRAPRKVTHIAITGRAAARGVGIGDRAAAIRRASPKARFDRSTEKTFGITLVRVPRNGGGRLQFAVDVETRRVTLIGVPYIAFCE